VSTQLAVNSNNKNQILAIVTVVLLFVAVVYHIWADWGLVTIHAKQMPLGKVIASIERQGHARIETDIDSSTPVTMDVVKVPLSYALEKLSVVASARWRLLYFAAGDKATLKTGEDAWFGGQHPTDWTMLSFPLGNMIQLDDDEDAPVLDPRQDTYTPKAPAPAALQTYFTEAAQATTAGFAFPTAWNPTVDSTPAGSIVEKIIPKLISKAHGRSDQVFYLTANNQNRGQGGFADNLTQLDPDLLAQRVQDEINRLPPEQKTEAQNNFDAQRAFQATLVNMTQEERAAAWMQHLQDPAFQQGMMNRQDARDAMMNHDQRMQRYSNYVNRKLSATGKL